MLRSIGKQSWGCVESVLKKKRNATVQGQDMECIPQASTGQGLQNGGLFVLVLERSCYDGKDLQKMKVGIEKHRVNRAVGNGPGSADE